MKIADGLSLATRMFKNRPLRTMLTVLGVSVGIGTVLFLVSFGYGLQNVILQQITTADSLLSLDVNPGLSTLVELTPDDIERFSKIDGVTEVARSASMSAQVSMGDTITDSVVNVVDVSFLRLDGIVAQLGKSSFSPGHEAIISSAGAKLFDMTDEEIIGKDVRLTLMVNKKNEDGTEDVAIVERPDAYKIIGVVDDENSSYVFIPMDTVSDLAIAKYDRAKVKVANNEVMNSVRDQIIDRGFLVSALSDTIDQVNKIFGIVQIILFSFGFIALVVSAIGMFNTMTIALLERINEIGIMRSIGITKKDIKFIFLVEAILMGFLGGLGGVVVGYISGQMVNVGINILAKSLGGRTLDLFFSPIWFVGIIVIFSTFVGFFTGIYPSFKAAKLNPLDALRYK